MLNIRKLNLTSIFLIFCFISKSQDLRIKDLLELKRGNIQYITNNLIGNGWSLSKIRKPEFEGVTNQIFDLEFLSPYRNSIESYLTLYIEKDQTVYYYKWDFNSKDTYNQVLNSFKNFEFDNQWVSSHELGGIENHYEKDDIHIEFTINTENSFAFINGGKFTLKVDNYFPERFTELEEESIIIQYKKDLKNPRLKEIGIPSSLTYLTELKVGGKVREYDEELKIDKIPPNDEYSISGPNGISVIVENGVITSINQRKKTTKN
jgi:hypothetical protein